MEPASGILTVSENGSEKGYLPFCPVTNLFSHDLPGGNILNRCQIPHGPAIDNPSEVTAPDVMSLGDGGKRRNMVGVGVMRGRACHVSPDPSPWWAQIELRHHPLGAFVINPEMQRNPTMSIRTMVAMD